VANPSIHSRRLLGKAESRWFYMPTTMAVGGKTPHEVSTDTESCSPPPGVNNARGENCPIKPSALGVGAGGGLLLGM